MMEAIQLNIGTEFQYRTSVQIHYIRTTLMCITTCAHKIVDPGLNWHNNTQLLYMSIYAAFEIIYTSM